MCGRNLVLLNNPLQSSVFPVQFFNKSELWSILDLLISINWPLNEQNIAFGANFNDGKTMTNGRNCWIDLIAASFSSPFRYQTRCLSSPRIKRDSCEKWIRGSHEGFSRSWRQKTIRGVIWCGSSSWICPERWSWKLKSVFLTSHVIEIWSTSFVSNYRARSEIRPHRSLGNWIGQKVARNRRLPGFLPAIFSYLFHCTFRITRIFTDVHSTQVRRLEYSPRSCLNERMSHAIG
jgi:hypothetical protein